MAKYYPINRFQHIHCSFRSDLMFERFSPVKRRKGKTDKTFTRLCRNQEKNKGVFRTRSPHNEQNVQRSDAKPPLNLLKKFI